jgi:ankyrin repeat protein
LEALLLKHGALINAVDGKGRTPLHYSFVSIDNTFDSPDTSRIDPFETISSLLGYKECDLHVQDKYGRTPLHYAAQRAATISAIYMIKKGA